MLKLTVYNYWRDANNYQQEKTHLFYKIIYGSGDRRHCGAQLVSRNENGGRTELKYGIYFDAINYQLFE